MTLGTDKVSWRTGRRLEGRGATRGGGDGFPSLRERRRGTGMTEGATAAGAAWGGGDGFPSSRE